MKKIKRYEIKLKKFLSGIKKSPIPPPTGGEQLIRVMIEGILVRGAKPSATERAISQIEAEFVDFNELRFAQAKDIIECVGREYPLIREKSHLITTSLRGVFSEHLEMSADYLLAMLRKDAKRHIMELGLDAYSGAYWMLFGLGMHAIPVSETLVECFEMDDLIPEDMNPEDVRSILERIIATGKAKSAYLFFTKYVEKSASKLKKYRKQKIAKAEAEAKAKAEAEKKKNAKKETKPIEKKTVKKKVKKKKKIVKKAASTKPAKTVKKKVKKTKPTVTKKKKKTQKLKSAPTGVSQTKSKKVKKVKKAKKSIKKKVEKKTPSKTKKTAKKRTQK